jgi:hypothetical protein
MGMDVYGNAPTAEVGTYFRRNVWGWHPLWEYVEDRHPEIACLVEHGHTNDGDGLDDEDSAELARRLREDLASGEVARYVADRDAFHEMLPDEVCGICEGTGQRPDGLYGVEWKKAGCNGCEDKGTKRPPATWYYLEVQDVAEFAEFLESCGGFRIH